MKVVLLAGGKGTRIAEESQLKPKPMIEIGGKPILWHIMKGYSRYGFNNFIVCAGYKQHIIKDYFANYYNHNVDITFDFSNGKNDFCVHNLHIEPWKVTVADTGLNTMTGGRVGRIKEYVKNGKFMLTYGDGVCDVNIEELLKFHNSHGKIATITTVTQTQQKGVLDIDDVGAVRSFREKRANDGAIINAGFMVLEPQIFDYIKGDETILESDVLEKLAAEGQLMSFSHSGFWQCMDNMREKTLLETLWEENKAPWKVW